MPRYGHSKYVAYRKCDRKNTYYTSKSANQAIQKLRRSGKKFHYYKCSICGRYHLTHYSKNLEV